MTNKNQNWIEKIRAQLPNWRKKMVTAGVKSSYLFLAGTAVLPFALAYQQGNLAAYGELLALMSNIGVNLLANLMQNGKDAQSASAILEEGIENEPGFHEALDELLKKLDVIALAQAELSGEDKAWFLDTLRKELSALNSLERFRATISGEGIVVQGQENTAVSHRGVHVGGNAEMIMTGDNNQLIITAAATADSVLSDLKPKTDLRDATRRYLEYLLDRYRVLNMRGMGISDRVALKLPLLQMYVPLKARFGMPEGETWTRDTLLAGRPPTEEEIEAMGERLGSPQSVLNQLKEVDGLVILGDPGAGKTTFLKMLALRLAAGDGELIGLGNRLPVLLPLSAYANALEEGNVSLLDFLRSYSGNTNAFSGLGDLLEAALDEGRALLLLDGLDEVKKVGQRHLVVELVENFYAHYRAKGNKFVLTSRIVGYSEARMGTLDGMHECTLVDFDQADIEAFVDRWTVAIETAVSGQGNTATEDAQRERDELIEAVSNKQGVQSLASNPLLLTILALMKRNGVVLPEKRVELYQKYVETLIRHWNLARSLEKRSVVELNVRKTVQTLAPLALWMHEESPGVGMVKREAMEQKLSQIFAERGVADVETAVDEFLTDARDHANILLERGPGTYGFIHLTFQEYLAAVAIAQQGQGDADKIAALLAHHLADARWHELFLLTIGYLGVAQELEKVASAVLLKLIEMDVGVKGTAVSLAGEAILDVGSDGITNGCRDQVRHALANTLQATQTVAVLQRAKAGVMLGKLGDTRPEMLDVDQMNFCFVPAGPFWLGSDPQDDPDANQEQEYPQHQVNLPYNFWIGQYPITQAQFEQFVAEDGYAHAPYWVEAEKHGRWKSGLYNNRTMPRELDELFHTPNHPVVGISWYEALALTRWLTERWQQKGWLPLDWVVQLPSEPEWEKTARGGVELISSPLVGTIQSGMLGASVSYNSIPNPSPKRIWPWDTAVTPNLANYKETGIKATNANGIFQNSETPYGCQELLGGQYEWTRSLYHTYPYEDFLGRETLDATRSRALRGRYFGSSKKLVRCASRDRDGPHLDFRYYGMRVLVSPPSGL